MSNIISRQAAIDAICGECQGNCIPCEHYPCGEIKALEQLTSIQPERKVGKWLKISPAGIYECSRCGQVVMTSDIETYKYCHGCGKRMEG